MTDDDPSAGTGAETDERPAPPSLPYAVKQVELAVRSHLDVLLAPVGVTALQFTAMTVLARRADLTSTELARNSFVRPQSTADLLAALDRRGLVERRRDPADGRRVLLRLTASGLALVRENEHHVADLERRMTDGLDDDQVALLRAALNRCRANLAGGAGAH